MTAWNDTDLAPSLVLTVAQVPENRQSQPTSNSAGRQQINQGARKNPVDDRMIIDPQQVRPTYAAVPFGNGWLLIQI